MSLQAIIYENNCLKVLDQLLLPHETKFIKVSSVEDGWQVINKMQVRGAPAIAIVGCISVAVELHNNRTQYKAKEDVFHDLEKNLKYMITSRPTAVNIKSAADYLTSFAEKLQKNASINLNEMIEHIILEAKEMLTVDIRDNQAIGMHGAQSIIKNVIRDNSRPSDKICVLTHCNTGSLATAGYGTALGVVRKLHEMQRLDRIYCTETRPYNQGARLTAYELVYEKIPATLIADSMVAALMQQGRIQAVIVGADRVVANGDTANKIGTYQIAVLANFHDVAFYVAAPFTSIDFSMKNGKDIIIEQRPECELTHLGGKRIAAEGISCWNPAFDVTPADLITGIITERGTFKPTDINAFKR